jgi:hypothetical protein
MEVSAMSDTELLIKEIQTLPTVCVHEALELIAALKQKRLQVMNFAPSEPAGTDSPGAENSPGAIEEALRM